MLPDGRAGSGRGHVRPAPLGVDDALPVRGQDRLAAQHVALDAGRGGRVVDGQRAQDRRRLVGPLLLVRRTPHEVGVLERRPGHAGLDEIEVELELRAVGPVALLEPRRDRVRPDPDRRHAVRTPGAPQCVPDTEALLDRDVDLPAELADVADPRGQRPDTVDVDRLRRQERKPLVADVGAAVRRETQDVPGQRAPQPERGVGVRDVMELGRAIGRQGVLEDLPVAHPHTAAGHDPEVVVGEPHDRQVGEDPTGGVQERRVDRPADRDVDLVDAEMLEGGQGTGSRDVEDRKGRQVHEARPVAHREVLGVDDRRPPARLPLGLAGHDSVAVLAQERLVGAVPERPLPARRLEELGAQLDMAVVRG